MSGAHLFFFQGIGKTCDVQYNRYQLAHSPLPSSFWGLDKAPPIITDTSQTPSFLSTPAPLLLSTGSNTVYHYHHQLGPFTTRWRLSAPVQVLPFLPFILMSLLDQPRS